MIGDKWSDMNRKTQFLVVISLFSMLTPIVNANAPTLDKLLTYQIDGNGVDVPEGYWVYGTFENEAMFKSQSQVVIEVTLLDAGGNELDVVTAMVRPTIIARGETGSFLAKSTVQADVAEIKYKLLSSVETDKMNFLYLDVSRIVKKTDGVEGLITNTHDAQWVHEAEVIASFFDVDGNLVDIQSWGANSYGKFEAGQSETFFISTVKDFETVTLNTQCDRASINMFLKLVVERPYKVIDSWTPPIGEKIWLIIQDSPEYIWSSIDVLLTDPLGNANTVRFDRSGLQDYRYEITPMIPGVWNVTWVSDPFAVDGGYTIVESGVLDAGFFTWDPEEAAPPTDNTTDPLETIESLVNSTGISVDDLNATASELIDSATTKAEEIVEALPEEVKQQIPGFPVMSVITAFSVVYFFLLRKN